MAKPSIFSRDYKKKMRKRKRRIILTIILAIIVVIGVFVKFELKKIDFSNMRDRIQAWVDSGKPEEKSKDDSKDEEKNKQQEETDKKQDEHKDVEEDKEMDLVVSDTLTVKAKYSEEDGNKKFISLEDKDNVKYDIAPSMDKVIIVDENQNIILFNINGDKQDITKQSYTSQSGSVFMKNDIMQSYEGYIWHEQVRFIDDSNIVYVSQLPYFGSASTNKYLWIYNIDAMTETCLWNYYGSNVTVGDVDTEKGIKINIDNNIYYIKSDGSVTQ